MKLSVKLLSGLTLIALVAVAVIGLSHSASATVDGKVYITSVGSSLTNETGMNLDDDGRLTTGTVYGTFESIDTTGIGARDIVADAETFIVTIVDSDLNETTNVTSDTGTAGTVDGGYAVAAGGDVLAVTDLGGVSTSLDFPGDKYMVTLDDEHLSPIVGDIDDIKVYLTTGNTDVVGVRIDSYYEGGGTAGTPAWVIVEVVSGTGPGGNFDIVYPTSAVESITASIKSVVSVGSITLTLTETGRDTGRFEGTVDIIAFVSGAAATDTGNDTDRDAAGAEANGTRATIASGDGAITVTYVDALTSGTAVDVKRTSILQVDTTTPTLSFSSPVHDTESQNRLPTFTGNVSDAQSGLDISSFALIIDDVADEDNDTLVVAANVEASYVGANLVSVDTGLLGDDGDNAIAFTYTETDPLPELASGTPDHLVDFQAIMNDIAGNIGYSDSDTANDEWAAAQDDPAGRHGRQPHVIKIDQKIPAFTTHVDGAAFTGIAYDAVTKLDNTKAVRDSIKLIFDGNIKSTSVSPGDFQVVFSDAGGTFVPASVVVVDNFIYLDIDSTIPSDNTPTVKIQGTIQDLAGNSTDAGSVIAEDTLEPVITVTLSGGSGTGTDGEAADGLTDDEMVITIATDEDLLGPPTLIAINTLTSEATEVLFNGSAIAQGGNVWAVTIVSGASTTGSVDVDVTVNDVSSNEATDDVDYDLDTELVDPTISPADGDETTESNPFITTNYATETSSVTVVEVLFNDVDVTDQVVESSDGLTFFFQPLVALANDDHTFSIESVDAAGNENTLEVEFEKSDRTDYEIGLFAGWNLFSLPSNPIDTDVNSVLSNSGIKQVVAYDATTPLQPWRIASKVGAGAYSSTTTPGLTNVAAGPGYWIETANFEDQKVALEGPTGPGDARPALMTIPTGNGWNLVGVVDQSRTQTQKGAPVSLSRPNSAGVDTPVQSSAYFNTVNNGRAYTFDTVSSKFWELAAGDTMKNGSGIWVFISPQSNGTLPHIVP